MSATILRNCTVFDGHSDEAIPGQDVLVENDRIVAISPQPIRSAAATVVDLKGRIAQLDTGGAVTRQWPVDVGIALGGSRLAVWNGRVIMSDPDRARIDVLDPASGQIRYIGGEGAGAGEFRAPTGVAAGADGRLYVLDSGNARIQVFTILGSP